MAESTSLLNVKAYHLSNPRITGGKRTFSSIVSRVKAKINEYDQGRYVPSLHIPIISVIH